MCTVHSEWCRWCTCTVRRCAELQVANVRYKWCTCTVRWRTEVKVVHVHGAAAHHATSAHHASWCTCTAHRHTKSFITRVQCAGTTVCLVLSRSATVFFLTLSPYGKVRPKFLKKTKLFSKKAQRTEVKVVHVHGAPAHHASLCTCTVCRRTMPAGARARCAGTPNRLLHMCSVPAQPCV